MKVVDQRAPHQQMLERAEKAEAELARVTAERDRLRAAIEAALPLTRGTATMVLSEELLSPLGRKILADDDDEPHAGG